MHQEEVDVVNDEDADIPFWPTADDYDHRDQNEVTPGIGQLLEQRLQQLNDRSDGYVLSFCMTYDRFTIRFRTIRFNSRLYS